MTIHRRSDDGKYHIGNKKYDMLVGSPAQVWHGTAFKTSGGLVRSKLMKNKHGRIVSKAKHNLAKKQKHLEKAGYFTKKGVFGSVYNPNKNTRKTKTGNKKKTMKSKNMKKSKKN